jgi:P27 family predicted phage terminase small subunit
MPRRPKPTALEILEGNPSQHAVNRFEPQFDHVIPECPDHLNKEAKKLYQRVAAMLHRAKIMTEADQIILASLCQSHAILAAAHRELNRSKLMVDSKVGGPRVTPLFKIINESTNTVARLCQELGLTPSARSKLRIDTKLDQTDWLDDAVFHRSFQRFA